MEQRSRELLLLPVLTGNAGYFLRARPSRIPARRASGKDPRMRRSARKAGEARNVLIEVHARKTRFAVTSEECFEMLRNRGWSGSRRSATRPRCHPYRLRKVVNCRPMVHCVQRLSGWVIVRVVIAAGILASCASAAGWESVRRLVPGQQVEVQTVASKIRGAFVSADASILVVRSKAAEQSIAINGVQRVRIIDPSRRLRNGLIGVGIGVGAGIGIGFAICPHCANEGDGGKFVAPLAGIGAAAGALAFVPPAWRTIYRVR